MPWFINIAQDTPQKVKRFCMGDIKISIFHQIYNFRQLEFSLD
jgi:hypothetical protein